jgi:O-antigen ligase
MDQKKRNFSLWIPFLWYASVSTRGLSPWFTPTGFDSSEFDYAAGSPMDRNFYLILIVIGVLILVRKRIQWGQIVRANHWFFLLFIYLLVSIFWSDFPAVAFKRWIKMIGSIVMALIVLTELPSVDSISKVLRRCFLLHIPIDIILVKYFREIGVDWDYLGSEMWVGLTRHKNTLGQVGMTAATFFTWDMFRKYKFGIYGLKVHILYLLMIFYLSTGPGGSRSATSIGVLAVGLCTMVGLQLGPKKNRVELNRYLVKGVFVLLLVLLIINLGMSAINQTKTVSGTILEMTGKDETLTGRTDLWKDILTIASRHPIRGVGYGSFWIGDKANDLWERHLWRPQEGHNGYIDVFVELGMVGVILLGLLLVSTFISIKEKIIEDFDFGVLRMVFFIMIVVHNVTESSYLRSDHNLWFIFLLVILNLPSPGKMVSKPRLAKI